MVTADEAVQKLTGTPLRTLRLTVSPFRGGARGAAPLTPWEAHAVSKRCPRPPLAATLIGKRAPRYSGYEREGSTARAPVGPAMAPGVAPRLEDFSPWASAPEDARTWARHENARCRSANARALRSAWACVLLVGVPLTLLPEQAADIAEPPADGTGSPAARTAARTHALAQSHREGDAAGHHQPHC